MCHGRLSRARVNQHRVGSLNVTFVAFVVLTFFRRSLFCPINFYVFFFISSSPVHSSLPGYRIRLGSSTDKKDTGRLHVDFAQARDDLYEWECRQRMMAREERHRRRIEEDRLRPPSPPPIVHYSEHECSQLGEKLKGRVHVSCFSCLFSLSNACGACGRVSIVFVD